MEKEKVVQEFKAGKNIVNEYEMLRNEIMYLMPLHNNLVTFTITTVVAILAIAATQRNPYLYLLPFCVIIPMSMRLAYYRRSLAKISAYMIVFLESEPDNLKWETRNLSFADYEQNQSGKKYALRYYECFVLACVCYGLYLYNYIKPYIQLQNWTWLHLVDLLWPFLLVVVVWGITRQINGISKFRRDLMRVWQDIKNAGDKPYQEFIQPSTSEAKPSSPIVKRVAYTKEEYEIVRAESQNAIDRQDNYNNLVFTLLSVSSAISTIYDNAAFILLVLYASAILLAYVLHYRNVVNYTTTYLHELERSAHSNGILWEHSIYGFREALNGEKPEWKWYEKATLHIIQLARRFRNFGNLILTIFLFVRLALIIYPEILSTYATTQHYFTLELGCICILAVLAGILNLVFTFSFYFDHSLKRAYCVTWESVLAEQQGPDDPKSSPESEAADESTAAAPVNSQ